MDLAIEKHIIWSKAAEIKATPTIFVNGRRLPELYSWLDFVETIEFEIKNEDISWPRKGLNLVPAERQNRH